MPAAAPAAQTFKQTFCAWAIIARLLLAAGTLITVAPSLRDAVSSAPNRHFAASHGSCCPGRDASSRWQLASAQHRLIASSIGPARVSAPSQRRDDVSAALPGRASPVSTAPKLLILMQSMTTMGRTWEACPRPQIIENLPSTTSPASLHVCLELRPSRRPTLLDQPPHLLCCPLPNVAASMLPHFACPPPPCRLFQCAGSAVSKRSHSFGELRRIVLAGLFSEREKSKIVAKHLCMRLVMARRFLPFIAPCVQKLSWRGAVPRCSPSRSSKS